MYCNIQGDGAKTVVSKLVDNLNISKMPFMSSKQNVTIAGVHFLTFVCIFHLVSTIFIP